MFTPSLAHGPAPWSAALLLAASATGACAQAQAPVTLELLGAYANLTDGQPDANALNFRGTWIFDGGHVARAEVLKEQKFDVRGGIVGASYTRIFDPDWYATGTLAFGHGGPNWASQRIDLDLSTEWTAARDIVSHVALEGADRGDLGLRLPSVASQAPVTLELLGTYGNLTAGQPDASALNFRGTWIFDGGHVARAEALKEHKFDASGGIVGASYTRVFDPDWYATGTLAFGHGGPNWANQRIDLDLATKWTAARDIVSHVALFGAVYDADRSDFGLRLSLAAYLPGPAVIEGGITFNVSDPGAVNSRMPFASVTWGREGEQYLTLRVASGTEAYLALGEGEQLVDFHSSSLGLAWRRWVDRRWGFIATAESYRNPTYKRNSLGAGVLVQY